MDQDERKKDVAGRPKPIPIREVVGEPGPHSTGNSDTEGDVPTSQASGPRGQRERPEGPRGKGGSRKSEGGRRRRPDRKGAASGREKLQRPSLERTPLKDLPFRSFEHDGSEWIVRLCGQSSTGSAMDPGAPLMHLVTDVSTPRPTRSWPAGTCSKPVDLWMDYRSFDCLNSSPRQDRPLWLTNRVDEAS